MMILFYTYIYMYIVKRTKEEIPIYTIHKDYFNFPVQLKKENEFYSTKINEFYWNFKNI